MVFEALGRIEEQMGSPRVFAGEEGKGLEERKIGAGDW